jgi:hypothetical protein
MSNIYKTQALMEQGVDFSSIYKEKQTVIKEMLGFDFDVSEIVDFLQAETNNFSKQSDLALDLDNNIYLLYTRWIGEGKEDQQEDEQEDQQEESKSESSDVSEWQEAIETLNMLIEDGGSKKDLAEWGEAVETLNMLIEG